MFQIKIIQKSQRLSNFAEKESTIGQLKNLMINDSQTLGKGVKYLAFTILGNYLLLINSI